MSKQLSFSATLSVVAMAALAFGMMLSGPERVDAVGDGAATAHGSLIGVLVQA